MQTFLPYPDFQESAKVLDYRRLGKQRVEGLQLLNSLLIPTSSKGWKNHPAREMWRGHEYQLAKYNQYICLEWISRGYKDTCLDKTLAIMSNLPVSTLPIWFGNPGFHAAHRSNLLRKDFGFYSKFNWLETPNLPYLWPSVINGEVIYRAKHSGRSEYAV